MSHATRLPFVVYGLLLVGLLVACAAENRHTMFQGAVVDNARVEQTHASMRQAIEREPRDPESFAAYCRYVPAQIDRQVSDVRGKLDIEADAVRIASYQETLNAVRQLIDESNTYLTDHCRCREMEFNRALVGFRERAAENRHLIDNTEQILRQRAAGQAQQSARLSEDGRRLAAAGRLDDAFDALSRALSFNSGNTQAQTLKAAISAFEDAREAMLHSQLARAEKQLFEVQKSGLLGNECATYLADIRARRARLDAAIQQADGRMQQARYAEAERLLAGVAELDQDRREGLVQMRAALKEVSLARAAEAQNDWAKSREHLLAAQERWPGSKALAALLSDTERKAANQAVRAAMVEADKQTAAGREDLAAQALAAASVLSGADRAQADKLNRQREALHKKTAALSSREERKGATWRGWILARACRVSAEEATCLAREHQAGAALSVRLSARAASEAEKGDWAERIVALGLARQAAPQAEAAREAELGALWKGLAERPVAAGESSLAAKLREERQASEALPTDFLAWGRLLTPPER